MRFNLLCFIYLYYFIDYNYYITLLLSRVNKTNTFHTDHRNHRFITILYVVGTAESYGMDILIPWQLRLIAVWYGFRAVLPRRRWPPSAQKDRVILLRI